MFGISPLGWIHTLGSLPAIPVAIYMFARHGKIVPDSTAGRVYFISMVIGSITIIPIAHEPVSYAFAGLTLLLLLVGFGVARSPRQWSGKNYVETIALTLTAFLLLLPAMSETLRRVPDGHPLAVDMKAPILLEAQAALLILLIVGLAAQVVYLRKHGRPRLGGAGPVVRRA